MILNWDHFSKIPVDFYQKLHKNRGRSDPAKDFSKILRKTFFVKLRLSIIVQNNISILAVSDIPKKIACPVLRVSYILIIGMPYAYDKYAIRAVRNGSDPRLRYEAGKRVF